MSIGILVPAVLLVAAAYFIHLSSKKYLIKGTSPWVYYPSLVIITILVVLLIMLMTVIIGGVINYYT